MQKVIKYKNKILVTHILWQPAMFAMSYLLLDLLNDQITRDYIGSSYFFVSAILSSVLLITIILNLASPASTKNKIIYTFIGLFSLACVYMTTLLGTLLLVGFS
jgi:hypothetical protein